MLQMSHSTFHITKEFFMWFSRLSNIQKAGYANDSSHGGREQSSCVKLTNRIQKWKKKNYQVSSLCVTMLPFKTYYVQNCNSSFFSSSFFFMWDFVYFLVESSSSSSRTVWSWRQEELPPPSGPPGGGRLHRHTAFTQLPCGIATERRLRTAGLLPEWTGHKPAWGRLSWTAPAPRSCPG